MNAIDYKKYSNMSQKQLFNALINAEKKEQKMQEKIKQSKELVKFLKAKIKKSLDKSKYEFVAYKDSGLPELAKNLPLSEQEKAELHKELQEEINRYYGDEL